jgi:hypothetical protein
MKILIKANANSDWLSVDYILLNLQNEDILKIRKAQQIIESTKDDDFLVQISFPADFKVVDSDALHIGDFRLGYVKSDIRNEEYNKLQGIDDLRIEDCQISITDTGFICVCNVKDDIPTTEIFSDEVSFKFLES